MVSSFVSLELYKIFFLGNGAVEQNSLMTIGNPKQHYKPFHNKQGERVIFDPEGRLLRYYIAMIDPEGRLLKYYIAMINLD